MPRKPPEPSQPTPPGVEPNKPKDPDVYGGEWGDTGGQKPKDETSDRPDRIPRHQEDGEGSGGAGEPPPVD